jgi:hypothetical protein
VGLIGIAAGLVMLRWGILATLVWHYTVDAALVGLLLIRSTSLYFRLFRHRGGTRDSDSLWLWGVFAVKRGRFEEDEDLLNRFPRSGRCSGRAASRTGPRVGPRTDGTVVHTGVLAFLAVCVVLGAAAVVKLKLNRASRRLPETFQRGQAGGRERKTF